MEIGLLTLGLHLHEGSSLKDKRRVIRSLMQRVRARHNVSVAETDHQDLLQRAELAFLAVGSSRDALSTLFDRITEEAERSVPGDVVEEGREFLG